MSWDDDFDYDNPEFSHTAANTLSEIDEYVDGEFVLPEVFLTAQRGDRVTISRYEDEYDR